MSSVTVLLSALNGGILLSLGGGISNASSEAARLIASCSVADWAERLASDVASTTACSIVSIRTCAAWICCARVLAMGALRAAGSPETTIRIAVGSLG